MLKGLMTFHYEVKRELMHGKNRLSILEKLLDQLREKVTGYFTKLNKLENAIIVCATSCSTKLLHYELSILGIIAYFESH